MFKVSRKASALVCTLAVAAAGIAEVSTATTAGAAGSSCAASSWTGSYYANKTMSGTPALSRCDAAINFDWGMGSPAPSIPSWDFSARWTSTQTLAAGSYRFTTTADDGVRVKVDGVTIIDAWKNENATTYNAMDTVTAGPHNVVVEYYESTGAASEKLSIVNVVDDSPTLNRLVSTDDFSATSVDRSLWSVYTSAGSANPLANDPSKVSESGGMLKLQTQGLSGSGVCLCTSTSKPVAPYGRWDFRARMTTGAANGGVIMLWPNAEDWPVGGEIDIAEISPAARQSSDFVVHYGAQNNQVLLTTPGDATAFHTYSVEWTPTKIRYWVDGLLLKTITDTVAIPTRAMHLVAQVGPHSSATSSTPQSELDIDWMKVYS